LSGIEQPSYALYSRVKSSIVLSIKQEKAEVLYSTLGNKLQNYVFENPGSLGYASRKLNIKTRETGLFSKKGLNSGIASDKDVIRAAFSGTVLKEKNNSDVINISNHKAVVVRVKKFYPARVKPFSVVKERIFDLLKVKKEQELAESAANKLAKEINGKGLSEAYARLNWKDMTVSRADKNFPLSSISEIYSRKISSNIDPQFFVVSNGKGDFVLYSVIAKASKIGQDTKGELGQWNKTLEGVYALSLENNYMSFLKNTIDIKYEK
jgi:peptidyl-prolyl cis-trans isomerase D